MADKITPNEEVAIEAQIEPVSESVQIPGSSTAQIPVNEPITTEPDTIEVPEVKTPEITSTPTIEPEIKPEPVSSPQEQTISDSKPSEPEKAPENKQPEPTQTKETITTVSVFSQTKNLARELLIKARNAIQSRKRKKLDMIMNLLTKKSKITNDEVEKLLHVSDATSTRYLSQLEKEGKIKQEGETGKSVFYSKI